MATNDAKTSEPVKGAAVKPVATVKTPVAAKVAAPAKGSTASKVGAAVRTLAPMVPLAIALAHKVIAPSPSTPAVAPAAVTQSSTVSSGAAPVPLLAKGHAVDWWFVFKLNAGKFPQCGGGTRTCPFGGTVQAYPAGFGQQYVVASSEAPALVDGQHDCLGSTTDDPVGASFDEVYSGNYHYAIWNDQPYGDPKIPACTSAGNCDAPWGHSKGIVAWNDAGEGFVMQVSTPSWPAAGSSKFPRKTDGNTLGCVKDDDLEVSQHFFALRLTKSDLVLVLQGLQNASVVTDPSDPQIVNNGGPADVQALVKSLGTKSASETLVEGTLSTGVKLISKPSAMNVPPWQMVSSQLGGVSLRTATWWASPQIPSTTATSTITCWDESLGKPGPVEIATSGTWKGTVFGLEGGLGTNFNHAKIGVSTSGTASYAIFGDENQQGTLTGKCSSSQNGRGGTFYVVNNAALAESMTALLAGTSAPVEGATAAPAAAAQ